MDLMVVQLSGDADRELFKVLDGVVAHEVLSALRPHWGLLHGTASEQWLELSQGLALDGAATDVEVLHLASTAPNDLLFGLAYGKYVDALATRTGQVQDDRLVFTHRPEFGVLGRLREVVLSKGYELELHAEAAEEEGSDFFDQGCMLMQSRSEILHLSAQLCKAKSVFIMGQLLSWIFVANKRSSANVGAGSVVRLDPFDFCYDDAKVPFVSDRALQVAVGA